MEFLEDAVRLLGELERVNVAQSARPEDTELSCAAGDGS